MIGGNSHRPYIKSVYANGMEKTAISKSTIAKFDKYFFNSFEVLLVNKMIKSAKMFKTNAIIAVRM